MALFYECLPCLITFFYPGSLSGQGEGVPLSADDGHYEQDETYCLDNVNEFLAQPCFGFGLYWWSEASWLRPIFKV